MLIDKQQVKLFIKVCCNLYKEVMKTAAQRSLSNPETQILLECRLHKAPLSWTRSQYFLGIPAWEPVWRM